MRTPLLTNRRGAALIIVLAFVVILSGIVVAYLARTSTDRQLAHATFHDVRADSLARSALDIVVANIKQEIVNGSATPAPTPGGSILYSPLNPANMVPVRSGTPAAGATPIPNLVRISIRDNGPSGANPMPSPGIPSQASALSTAPSPSPSPAIAKQGEISLARWNMHYLAPKADTLKDDPYPVSSFPAPDWVIVTTTGPREFTTWKTTLRDLTDPDFAIGRYAYAVYDEGGLLDVNVAGYPSNMELTQAGRKGSLAFADLTVVGIPNGSSDDPKQGDRIVGWRNYASAQPEVDNSGTFPKFSFTTGSTGSIARYFDFVRNDTTGFLSASTVLWNGASDQKFVDRQELLDFQSDAGFSTNLLQTLGTFSREADANIPQWSPAAPDSTNPNFQLLRVTGGGFPRNDGNTAALGDPYLNKRFLLQRLNWLTYKGPSATRTIPPSQPGSTTDPDYDMWLLTSRFGVSATFLQQGTVESIKKYFGLDWDTTNERWNYVAQGGTIASSIAHLEDLTSIREPDFFELLQAGIINGSLGDSSSPDFALPTVHQQSKMLQILTIGANLISQARTDSYPIRIACSVSGTTMEALGATRLPYVSALTACPVAGTAVSGGINWFMVPNLWDPFRDNWDITETNVSSILTPAYLRPQVRLRVTGTVGFGGATTSPPESGSITAVTSFATTIPNVDANVVFKTGVTTGNAFGRDGYGEASRMSSSDCATVPATYTTTTSPTTATSAWNSVSRPARPDGSLPGTTNFIAFRCSLPGNAIPVTSIGQNPVLILNPQFQMRMEYQSANGSWYPYSFLQGNSATTTWIISNLNLVTIFSMYGNNPSPPSTAPTILNSGTATLWNMTSLWRAPTFAKADPRSIRYNSQIGVVDLSKPPMAVFNAGIIGSIWPNTYATPPPMWTVASPGPTPSPNPNPATYAQTISDNAPAMSNPYNEIIGTTVRPIIMNRPFRSVGEMGYGFRDQPFKTLDFSSASSPDAGLLDLFAVYEYDDASGMRAGVVNLNSLQPAPIAAALGNTIRREDTPRVMSTGPTPTPSPQPSPLITSAATAVAGSIVAQTSATPIVNRANLTRLVANETGLGASVQKTQRESIPRALGEIGQTRTWNLMIDLIAQSGRYPPTATGLTDFIVQGEKRYWLHVAIDRFSGKVVDQQVEAVNP